MNTEKDIAQHFASLRESEAGSTPPFHKFLEPRQPTRIPWPRYLPVPALAALALAASWWALAPRGGNSENQPMVSSTICEWTAPSDVLLASNPSFAPKDFPTDEWMEENSITDTTWHATE